MVADIFASFLEELGTLLKVKLSPDANNSCLIKMKIGVTVQLEIDRSQEYLILGCNLGNIPTGKYRENLFREALKANARPSPRRGDFAFSQRANSMVLFEKFNVNTLKAEDLANELSQFSAKAKIWSDAISKNEIPVIETDTGNATKGSGMFGLSR